MSITFLSNKLYIQVIPMKHLIETFYDTWGHKRNIWRKVPKVLSINKRRICRI